jgi:hypothetical protein
MLQEQSYRSIFFFLGGGRFVPFPHTTPPFALGCDATCLCTPAQACTICTKILMKILKFYNNFKEGQNIDWRETASFMAKLPHYIFTMYFLQYFLILSGYVSWKEVGNQ